VPTKSATNRQQTGRSNTFVAAGRSEDASAAFEAGTLRLNDRTNTRMAAEAHASATGFVGGR
jgi:hypothetical protein